MAAPIAPRVRSHTALPSSSQTFSPSWTKSESARAIIAGFSLGGHLAALLAARHPERVTGAILIAPTAPFGPNNPSRNPASFLAEQADHEGWGKFNKHYWLENYEDFLSFFFERIFPEPHSTKQIEDGVSWGAQTSPEVLVDTIMGRFESAHE